MNTQKIVVDPELQSTIWLLTPEEKAALEKSLLSEGCRDPLVLWNNRILDGHNRYEICTRLKIPFKTTTMDLPDIVDAKLWIRTNQVSRRNLTNDQRVMNAVEIAELKSAIAMRERAKTAGEERAKTAERKPDGTMGTSLEVKMTSKLVKKKKPKKERTREKVSKATKVSESKMRTALKIKKEDPQLAARVLAGEITLRDAKKVIDEREREEARKNAPPLVGKYRVFYADPPWKYTSGDQHTDVEQETVIGTHYPQMTIKEICDLDIKSMTDENAVLFLWVTSPLLEESFEVVKKWGFEYKTTFIWDKVKHNVGHYNSARHELILVCTKGSCKPDNPKLYDSVLCNEDGSPIERTVHSAKPERMRIIIDDLYTIGERRDRIELFPRGEIPAHWDGWRSEAKALQP